MLHNFWKKLPLAAVVLNLYIPLLLALFIAVHGVEDAHAAQSAAEQTAPKMQATAKNVDAEGNLLTIKLDNRATVLADPYVAPAMRSDRLAAVPLAEGQTCDILQKTWVEPMGSDASTVQLTYLPGYVEPRTADLSPCPAGHAFSVSHEQLKEWKEAGLLAVYSDEG